MRHYDQYGTGRVRLPCRCGTWTVTLPEIIQEFPCGYNLKPLYQQWVAEGREVFESRNPQDYFSGRRVRATAVTKVVPRGTLYCPKHQRWLRCPQ